MFGDEFKLASLDFMGSTAELEAKAQAALKSAGGDYSTPESQEGADGTGSIRVTVDRRGAVADVHVGREWRDHLKPAEFAAGLLAAYRAAVTRAVAAQGMASLLKDQGKSVEEREREEHRRSVQIQEDLSYSPPDDDRAWLRTAWDKLYELDNRLHNLGRADGGQPPISVSGPYGRLTLTCQGDSVTGITGDSEWIALADPQQLRAEALATFRAAKHEGK